MQDQEGRQQVRQDRLRGLIEPSLPGFGSGERRFLAVWGLIYIGYTADYAVRDGLDELLIAELEDEEEVWLDDDGCPGESVPNWGLELSGLKREDCRSDEELEAYLVERRKAVLSV